MTERWTHDDVRDRAFEYRRGELEVEKRERVEAHLQSCAACRDYVEKLFTLMSSPTQIEAPSTDYADTLFAKIEAQIESEQRGGEKDDHQDVVFAPAESGFRWSAAAVGLAAGFLLAVGVVWLLSTSGTFAPDPSSGEPTLAERRAKDEGPADEPADEHAAPTTEAAAFAELRAEPSKRPGIGVLASQDARWSLDGDDDLVLELEHGTVLVEYLPREERQFRVRAPDMDVRVVGTIFYVSANGASTAGVVTGAVEVEADNGETVQIEEGQRITAGGEVEPIPTESADVLRAQVDVRRHHAALRQRMNRAARQQRPDSEASESEPAREKVARRQASADPPSNERELTGTLARRRAEAESAIRAGQYRRAETIYRDLIAKLDPAHPAAPSIHLDLAGLYLEQMDSPKKALPYLRGFLQKWPNDVASSAVQRRLCVVAGELGVDEPRCSGRDSEK
jgi:anti-sigma factor RsiW